MAKDAQHMFEFGTATGRTTYLWARNAPAGARIGTITLHPDHGADYRTAAGDSVVSTRDAQDESRFDAFVYSGTDVAGKVTQYFGDSKVFDEGDWVARCDIVFVDGSHAFSYVASDSAKALRMVKPGGVVLWHDYRADAPGRDVRRCLDALAMKLPLVRLAGTRLVAYRAPAHSSEHGNDEPLT
jgi:predicted O-methyltransferase YrrM